MNERPETVRLEASAPAPANRARLARYLEVPSAAQIDPVTVAEVRRLDERRDELLSLRQRAVAVPVRRVYGRWIELKGGVPPVEASEAYARQLLNSSADALIVAAFTIGGRVDEVIKRHLEHEQVYEAFVLKQWAATITEQARVALTRGLRDWAERNGRSLLQYDGPGYNGWPLRALHPLLDLLYGDAEPATVRPIRVTDSGVLLPTNSMLIVYGVTCASAPVSRADELLAQCHRCAMRNCRYRTAATADVAG